MQLINNVIKNQSTQDDLRSCAN